MSCYFRDLDAVFKDAKIEVTPANKKDIDRAIHNAIGNPSANHDTTRDEVRRRLGSSPTERQAFVEQLLKAIES